mmetsp:Transcript_4277/g.7891  ORF Transcript_4277/g.7891 Transcript_4277/m.7891 type:complete len:235 (+) Transcript_4277:3451-4155(+)
MRVFIRTRCATATATATTSISVIPATLLVTVAVPPSASTGPAALLAISAALAIVVSAAPLALDIPVSSPLAPLAIAIRPATSSVSVSVSAPIAIGPATSSVSFSTSISISASIYVSISVSGVAIDPFADVFESSLIDASRVRGCIRLGLGPVLPLSRFASERVSNSFLLFVLPLPIVITLSPGRRHGHLLQLRQLVQAKDGSLLVAGGRGALRASEHVFASLHQPALHDIPRGS